MTKLNNTQRDFVYLQNELSSCKTFSTCLATYTLYNIHYANKKKIRFENYLLDKSSHPAFVRGTLWLQKPLGLNRYTLIK